MKKSNTAAREGVAPHKLKKKRSKLPNTSWGNSASYTMEDGGPVKPIITTDKNDPRLKAYNDSLNAYTNYKALQKEVLKHGEFDEYFDYDSFRKNIERKTKGSYQNSDGTFIIGEPEFYFPKNFPDIGYETMLYKYKKPVQSVIYDPSIPMMPMIQPQSNVSMDIVNDGRGKNVSIGPDRIMMPSGQEISRSKFIKQYGEPAWKKATNQKFKQGGLVHQMGDDPKKLQATRQDSLDVYNNAIKLKQYYDKLKRFYKTPEYDKSTDQYFYTSHDMSRIIEDSRETYLDAMTSSIKRGKNDYNYKTVLNAYPNETVEGYRNQLRKSLKNVNKSNDTKFYYKDLFPSKIDPYAPEAIYDTRIAPQGMVSYPARGYPSKVDKNKIPPGGIISGLLYYDPIAVAPWDILNEKQRKQRLDEYGTSGTPFAKKPTKGKSSSISKRTVGQKVDTPPVRARATYGYDEPPWSKQGAITFEKDTPNISGNYGQYVFRDTSGTPRVITQDEYKRLEKLGTPKFQNGGLVDNPQQNTRFFTTVDKYEKPINYFDAPLRYPSVVSSEPAPDKGVYDIPGVAQGLYLNSLRNPNRTVGEKLSEKFAYPIKGDTAPQYVKSIMGWGMGDYDKPGVLKTINDSRKNSYLKRPYIDVYENGGLIQNEMIPINIEKNELLVDQTGKVIRGYPGQDPHNEDGKDPNKNFVYAPQGATVVPANMKKAYESGDKLRRDTIMKFLHKRQVAEGRMKMGGIVADVQQVDATGQPIGPTMDNGKFVKNTGKNTNSSQVTGLISTGLSSVGNLINKPSNMSTGDAVNNTVDSIASAVPVYGQIYGLAKTGSDLTRGIVQKDTSDASAVVDKALQPVHSMVIDHAASGNWGDAAASLFSGGIKDMIEAPSMSRKDRTREKNKMENAQRLQDQITKNQLQVNANEWLNNQPMKDEIINSERFAYGGIVKKYNRGGLNLNYDRPDRFNQAPESWANKFETPVISNPGMTPFFRPFDNQSIGMDLTVPNLSSYSKPGGLNLNNPAFDLGATYKEQAADPYSGYLPNPDRETTKPNNFKAWVNKNRDPLMAGAGTALNSIGPIYDLIMSRKGYDRANYGRLNPRYITDDAAMAEVDSSVAMGKDAIRRSNPSGGGMRNALLGLVAKRAGLKAGIAERTQNQNVGIFNQAQQANLQVGMQEQIDTAQNKARWQDIRRKGVRDIGQNIAYGVKDYQTGNTNELAMKLLMEQYGDYQRFADFINSNPRYSAYLNKGK